MQTRSGFLTSAGALATVAAASELSVLAAPNHNASVILVHAAWEDGSAWSKVIVPLVQQGIYTVAAPIPLTTMDDDVAMVEHIIDRTTGPVVLVSHAYSGAVISSVRNPRVQSLVFINSLLPAEGETVADVFYRKPPHPKAPRMKPDENGLVWMPRWAFGHSIAPKATSAELAVLAASQRPLSVPCIQKKVGPPAWKSKPVVVPACRAGRPNRHRHAAFHGQASRLENALVSRRSHCDGDGTAACHRADLGGAEGALIIIAARGCPT